MSGMQPDYPNFPGQPYNPMGLPPPQPISGSQLKRRHGGAGVIVMLIFMTLLFFGAAGFGAWAFLERTDYKNNVDKKVEQGVGKAVDDAKAAQLKEFEQREKEPLKTYKGPSTFGAVEIKYPKTWSAYIQESQAGNTPVNGYFHPNFVPGISADVAFALHVEVLEADYSDEIKQYDSAATKGSIKVKAIRAVNVPTAAPGIRIDGEIRQGQKGTVVMFPLRDKTLKLTAETEKFIEDFDKIILKYLIFAP